MTNQPQFPGIPTNRLPRNAAGRQEAANRAERLEVARAHARRWNGTGRHWFEKAAERVISRGRIWPLTDSAAFATRRVYAYVHTLDSQAKEWMEAAGERLDPQANSWLSVDHIIPLSKGGLSAAFNLAIVAASEDQAKGDRTGVRLASISVPEDFEIFDSHLGRHISELPD